MARDDWRLRIELNPGDAHGLLARLHLVDTDAGELASELRNQRLAVTHDEDTVFVYADSLAQLGHAVTVIDHELGRLGIDAQRRPVADRPLLHPGRAAEIAIFR